MKTTHTLKVTHAFREKTCMSKSGQTAHGEEAKPGSPSSTPGAGTGGHEASECRPWGTQHLCS